MDAVQEAVSVTFNQTLGHNPSGHPGRFCSFEGGDRPSRGIFFNENPLDKSYNIFALHVILLVLAHQVVYFLLRPLKQTKFVCSVVAGILIGPHMLGKLHIFRQWGLFPFKDTVLTSSVGSLGIALFIFLVAVKMDISMLRRTAQEAMIIGSLGVLVPYATTVAATYLLPMSGIRHGFFRFLFSSGLSVTRFANVADAFDELNMLTSQQSQLVLSFTMLGEIFTWTSLIMGVCYRHRNNPLIPVWVILTVVGVMATAVALRSLSKKIIARTSKGQRVNESLVVSILVMAMVMAFMTDLIGSFHLGMLILGLAMPDGPPLGSAIVERAEYMVKEFMMPVFYVLVGYHTNIFSIDWRFWEIIVFVTLSFTAKFVATLLGALACRHHLQNAVLLGLMVNIKGPNDLYLMIRWRNHNDVSDNAYTILVLSHVLVTALVTPLIEKLYQTSQKMKVSDRVSMRSVQASSIYEEFKVLCCVHGEDNIPGIISLLEASNWSQSGKLSAVIVHLNDLMGRAAPFVVRNDKKLRRVATNKSDRVAHQFECHTRNSGNPMELTNFTVVAPYKTMHENIRHIAKKERTTLIILPYRKVQRDTEASEAVVAKAKTIRNFNCHMLGCNPCAVGIFVNKGLGRCLSYGGSSFSCNVAVIFAGGHDDREALAYATRMLMQRSVRVTLLRLIVRCPCGYVEDMLEKKLDDGLVEDFRIIGTEDNQAKYYEKPAVNLISTFDGIRALQEYYHLVITGRESLLIMSLFEESLDTQKSWGENPELGILGDFIASDDYNGGKSSALIMQRYPCNVDTLAPISKRRSHARYEEDYLLGRLP